MIKSFDIEIQFNEGYWIATNDVLPIATESKSLQGLIDRVNLAAPEMALENSHVKAGETIKLTFHIESELKAAA